MAYHVNPFFSIVNDTEFIVMFLFSPCTAAVLFARGKKADDGSFINSLVRVPRKCRFGNFLLFSCAESCRTKQVDKEVNSGFLFSLNFSAKVNNCHNPYFA